MVVVVAASPQIHHTTVNICALYKNYILLYGGLSRMVSTAAGYKGFDSRAAHKIKSRSGCRTYALRSAQAVQMSPLEIYYRRLKREAGHTVTLYARVIILSCPS